MDLISKHISLHGVPGYETLGYEDWFRQCKHEFENNILKSVQYEGFNLVEVTEQAEKFKAFETVTGTDGTVNAQGIEILLEQEDDGKWRMAQKRILPAEESAHDKLLPYSV